MEKINILFVASEAAPLIKIGGLGDYVGSLPKALISEAHQRDVNIKIDIRIALPFAQGINPLFIDREQLFSFTSNHGNKTNHFNVYTAVVDAIPHYILETAPSLICNKMSMQQTRQKMEKSSFLFLWLVAI